MQQMMINAIDDKSSAILYKVQTLLNPQYSLFVAQVFCKFNTTIQFTVNLYTVYALL